MHRRELIAGGLSVAGALAMRSVRGQPVPTRAAIVIGVDRVGNLQPLSAAGIGARKIASWLAGEGFDVKLFVDDQSPVKVGEIFEAVNKFVNRATLEQLVIYFGGHGFIKGTGDEYGVLSGALDNPNEAINLTDSAKFAWYSRIPNVVFISDACRSRADSLQTDAISGSTIFPHKLGQESTQVDVYLATAVGTPAYELKLKTDKFDSAGIYTACFLDAFKRPYASSVKVLEGKAVVPNRLLPPFLNAEVPKRARAAKPTLEQHPFARVCSADVTYIGSVSGQDRSPEGNTLPTVSDVAVDVVARAFGGGAAPQSSRAVEEVAKSSGFANAQATILQARGLMKRLARPTGLVVSGQRVETATARPGVGTTIHNSLASERPSAVVEVEFRGAPAASVVLRFADGTGTVIAALESYTGTIVIVDGRVVSTSYVPSGMAGSYDENRLSQMHAAVATAAQFGVFRIDGPPAVRAQKAEQLADRIRIMKGTDPTLGLYAAYAYADANVVSQVRSVRGYMHSDLRGVDLFDVAMLAGDLASKPPGAVPVCPFCPMLSQGWGYLRVREVNLPDGVDEARDHLRQSLWLTLDPLGVKIVEGAVLSGRVL